MLLLPAMLLPFTLTEHVYFDIFFAMPCPRSADIDPKMPLLGRVDHAVCS